MYLIA